MGIVPYIMPGFGLAKKSAEVFDATPRAEGLILHKHGIFTFGASAREAYERMIEMVTLAEERLTRRRNAVFVARALPERIASYADIAPLLRSACSLQDAVVEGAWRRLILDVRTSPAILDFVNGGEIMRYSQAGPVVSDHAVRIKGWPLVVPPPNAAELKDYAGQVQEAARAFIDRYDGYVARHQASGAAETEPIDPLPRVILIPGLGLVGLGRTKREARVSADLAESAVQTITDAEAIGRFESISEADVFACEHWGLQQAKLAKIDGPLTGHVAVITGAGGAIGSATARAFAQAGAEVALLDLDEKAAAIHAKAIGSDALALKCDVADANSVRAAFAKVVETFGGVDIAVSNAGTALMGLIGDVDEALLKQSFEINFYGHQRVAQAAVKIMRQQGTGGCLLFNVSKQAINPGPRFGPYGLPKAATLFLVRQYALDYGAAGIRANAVNADRIRSGLLTPEMIAERSKARGLSEKDYMAGNLLGREVTADDVAQAFLHQALELKTTADVTTVDGGNIAAALR
jgi:NAD(P)-dependent dehydrogenase (short-subunit alcohol dehydrogenase family)